jgi:hypothetical protein
MTGAADVGSLREFVERRAIASVSGTNEIDDVVTHTDAPRECARVCVCVYVCANPCVTLRTDGGGRTSFTGFSQSFSALPESLEFDARAHADANDDDDDDTDSLSRRVPATLEPVARSPVVGDDSPHIGVDDDNDHDVAVAATAAVAGGGVGDDDIATTRRDASGSPDVFSPPRSLSLAARTASSAQAAFVPATPIASTLAIDTSSSSSSSSSPTRSQHARRRALTVETPLAPADVAHANRSRTVSLATLVSPAQPARVIGVVPATQCDDAATLIDATETLLDDTITVADDATTLIDDDVGVHQDDVAVQHDTVTAAMTANGTTGVSAAPDAATTNAIQVPNSEHDERTAPTTIVSIAATSVAVTVTSSTSTTTTTSVAPRTTPRAARTVRFQTSPMHFPPPPPALADARASPPSPSATWSANGAERLKLVRDACDVSVIVPRTVPIRG